MKPPFYAGLPVAKTIVERDVKEGLRSFDLARGMANGRRPRSRARAREDRARGEGRRDAPGPLRGACTGTPRWEARRRTRCWLGEGGARGPGGPGRSRADEGGARSGRSRTSLDVDPVKAALGEQSLPRHPALRRQHDLLRLLPRPRPGRDRPAPGVGRHPRPEGRDQLPHDLQRRPQLRAVLGRPRGDARGPGGRPAQQPGRDGLQLDADHGDAREGQGLREGVHRRLPRGHQQDDAHPRDRRVRADAPHPELEVRQVPEGRRGRARRGREARLPGLPGEGLRDLPRGRAARREVVRGDGPPGRLLRGARRPS